MKLLVTGGTGFIGGALCGVLEEAGHELILLSRTVRPQTGGRRRVIVWQPPAPGPWERELDGTDGVVHLAGESIVAKRWTPSQKQRLAESRVKSTRAIVEAIGRAARRPAVLVNASAVGYYGPHGDESLDEDAPPGSDFLAQLCQQWENAARDAEGLGVRVVRLRIGIVLARDGGALAKMLPAFRLGLGGPVGTGRQWMSWIHRDDVVGLIRLALEDARVRGAVNVTAPTPVTMREFTATLGRVLRRPAILPVPGPALTLLLGEMAGLLLTGQRVMPAKARALGYAFRYATLEAALSSEVTRCERS